MSLLVLLKKVRTITVLRQELIPNIRKTVGSKVKNVKVGDRVALEPGATCREYSENRSEFRFVFPVKASVTPANLDATR